YIRSRILLSLIAVLASWAVASPAAAEREPNTCDEIAKGDRASCKAEARSCDGDAWARRQCERKIAIAHDECLSDRFEKIAARKREMWDQVGGNDAMAGAPKDDF